MEKYQPTFIIQALLIDVYRRKGIHLKTVLDAAASDTFPTHRIYTAVQPARASSSYAPYVDMLVLNANDSSSSHTQAGRPAWFSSGGLGAASKAKPGARVAADGPVLRPSLGGVGVAGVQAGLRRRGVAAVLGGWRAVEGLRAPPQVLQGLQEGPARPLLLQRRGTLLLHLRDLSEGHRLRFEAGLARSAGAALAPRWAFGDGQLLGELLHGRGHEVGRQDVEAGGLHDHLTHSSHC